MKEIHKIYLWFFSAILLVGIVLTLVYSLYEQAIQAEKWRTHTYIVIEEAETFLSTMKDAETGQRGYLLSGDEGFLQPYLSVRDGFENHISKLQQLTLDMPVQQQRMALLRQLATRATYSANRYPSNSLKRF